MASGTKEDRWTSQNKKKVYYKFQTVTKELRKVDEINKSVVQLIFHSCTISTKRIIRYAYITKCIILIMHPFITVYFIVIYLDKLI